MHQYIGHQGSAWSRIRNDLFVVNMAFFKVHSGLVGGVTMHL
jgi:hypothetical protein